jgi:pimeloyl-ACP methyl ester carboxylesterase
MIKLAKPIVTEHLVHVAADAVTLDGNLRLPEDARAVVLFAHGSGSGRHSSRNRHVAQLLNEAKLATLLIDLLTANEEAIDLHTGHLRFDIELLARRLVSATDWLTQRADTRYLPIGYFGASTGAAAALVAATKRPDVIGAIVSRGFGGAGPAPCSRAHAAHRRWKRCPGDRAEPNSPSTTGRREAACDRPGSDAPLRRAWSA